MNMFLTCDVFCAIKRPSSDQMLYFTCSSFRAFAMKLIIIIIKCVIFTVTIFLSTSFLIPSHFHSHAFLYLNKQFLLCFPANKLIFFHRRSL